MDLVEFYKEQIDKKTPISQEIRDVANDIRQLIQDMDNRIIVDEPKIYLIDAPPETLDELECLGFYYDIEDVIFIPQVYPVDSFAFYHDLLHEMLHFVHHHKNNRPLRFNYSFEEIINEYMTVWLIVHSKKFEKNMTNPRFVVELEYVLLRTIYTDYVITLKSLFDSLNVNMNDAFYAYCTGYYEFFFQFLPPNWFELI